jgi:hypothetical protein
MYNEAVLLNKYVKKKQKVFVFFFTEYIVSFDPIRVPIDPEKNSFFSLAPHALQEDSVSFAERFAHYSYNSGCAADTQRASECAAAASQSTGRKYAS